MRLDNHIISSLLLPIAREARSMAFLNCSLISNFAPISPSDRWRRALVLESYKRSLPWYCVGQGWLSRVGTSNCQSSRRGWTHQPSILEIKTYPGNNLCGWKAWRGLVCFVIHVSVHEDCDSGVMAVSSVSSCLKKRFFRDEHSCHHWGRVTFCMSLSFSLKG